MTKKMTKKDFFTLIARTCADNQSIVDFCNHEIELLSKKSASGEKRMTATQKENEKLKVKILSVLTHPMTVTQILKADKDLSILTNQKVSALLRLMVLDGQVIRTTDKKTTLFMRAVEDDE